MFDIEKLRSNTDGRTNNYHIYIQVPFCNYKCSYCCFMAGTSQSDLTNHKLIPEYLRSLMFDIECFDLPDKPLQSIVFGGGTPTLLDSSKVQEVIQLIESKISKGVTRPFFTSFETTPELATYSKLKSFYDAGMQRVSIGVQSYVQHDLKILGRINTPEDSFNAFKNARKAGYSLINIDLLMNFPGSTMENWKENLRIVLEQSPEYITTNIMGYGYTGAEQFENRLTNKGYLLPTIADRVDMYKYAFDELEKHGYEPVDFVVFSKKGLKFPYEVHGLGMTDNIVAFGPSVLSALPEGAYYTPPLTREYIKSPLYMRMHSPFKNNVYPIMHGHLICNGLLSRDELESLFECTLEEAINRSDQARKLLNILEKNGVVEWVKLGLQFRSDKIVEGLVLLWDYQKKVKKTV